MNFSFQFADKQHLDRILSDLFRILHSNMSVIAPTGNSYDDDFGIWFSNIVPAFQKDARQIVLMYTDGKLSGYFQYYINNSSLMMEEIQIEKEFQGSGLFSALYSWLIKQLPKDIKTVEAYSNKKNYKSQAVLVHLGLVQAGENKNGNSYYYKGDYSVLSEKYGRCQ